MGVCALTRIEGKFVKSHIYPKAFLPSGSGLYLATISSRADQHPKKSPTGFYDRELVTQDGENILQKLDSYAADTLLSMIPTIKSASSRSNDGQYLGLKNISREKFDFDKLKKFSLSLIWRFGASIRAEAKNVKLGPHLEIIRQYIIGEQLLEDDRYRFFFVEYKEGKDIPLIPPSKMRLDGVNYWRLIFGGYALYVVVDSRPLPELFNKLIIMRGEDWNLPVRSFYEGPFIDALAEIVDRNNQRFGSPWGSRLPTP